MAFGLALLVAPTLLHAAGDDVPRDSHPGLPEPGLPPKSAGGLRVTRTAAPADVPDIYGPGAVLNAGNLHMKVTNIGMLGNPFPHLSSDPSAQWPGPSGVEYLNALVLAVGSVKHTPGDPTPVRRVSSGAEWRPATLEPEDRIYRSHEGINGGRHLTNDDADRNPSTGEFKIDEDFLDGRDDDGDGKVDEDYAAFGQLMFSSVMRDDTPAAQAMVGNEPHEPLGLECRQLAWTYSMPGFANYNVIEYTITNRSGGTLDSVYLGFPADLDAGSTRVSAGYYADDQSLPSFPGGLFRVPVSDLNPLYQGGACRNLTVPLHGFSVVDNDGDGGATPGVVSVVLLGHTTDPFEITAPWNVGFTSFRSCASGTSYASGGAPVTDEQRYLLMSSGAGIDPATGFIEATSTGQPGDWVAWNSIGPFRIANDGSVTATIAVGVERGSYDVLREYPEDYARFRAGAMTQDELFVKYPALEDAVAIWVAYQGVYELPRPGFERLVPDCVGCEWGIRLPKGSPPIQMVEPLCGIDPKLVFDYAYTWFNMDCDRCTGVPGRYLRRWDVLPPPLPPNLNVTADHNYSDNPERVIPAGDRHISLAWDNLSESTPDYQTGWFDFRTYRVWKVSEWRRPEGTSAPTDDDWTLLAELRLFDYRDSNFTRDPVTDTLVCPRVWVQNWEYPPGHPHCSEAGTSAVPLASGGCRDTATVSICLRRGDLWDRQSGWVLRPDTTVDCVRDAAGACVEVQGRILGRTTTTRKTRYRIGRYRLEDREVKNGFTYFYAVTAGDSSTFGEFFGRRVTAEANAVVPQAATRSGRSVWVVPNPYRGYRNIAERSSAWDLNPNATDPTGTHVDFLGLPRGPWTIRIYTVAGDLVADLHHGDAVNESARQPVMDAQGTLRPGYNRQQDHAGDGQARWNLLSRNGQDVVSGIYVFSVESGEGVQRGRFVIVR